MTEEEEKERGHGAVRFEVHTYGAVAYVSVTKDVANAVLKAGEEARGKRPEADD